MITIRIGQRGQITIPRSVRRQLGVEEGDYIALVVEKDQFVLRPVNQTLLDLRGSVPVAAEQDFSAIRKKVIAARAGQAATDAG